MKKRKIQIGSLIISIALIVASGMLLRPVVEEVLRTISLRQQISEVTEVLMLLELENESLQDQRLKLNDPDYVKSYARANYMLTKEGEQIYYLPKNSDND
jgi:cell division protein DivIC